MPLLAVALVLPVLILGIFGLIALIDYGYMLYFVALLAFSIPELLMMVEEISRRYRLLLKTHVPFIENTRLSLLVQGYDNKEKLMSGFRAAKWAWNSYRIVRLASPLTAVLTEFRSQVVGKMMTRVSAEFQLKLKQALLQEAVFVAIDLYSGRFRVQAHHQATQEQDNRNMAPPLEPLRICFVGQTGSGKSSIIKANNGKQGKI
jgi:hypothetical protein